MPDSGTEIAHTRIHGFGADQDEIITMKPVLTDEIQVPKLSSSKTTNHSFWDPIEMILSLSIIMVFILLCLFYWFKGQASQDPSHIYQEIQEIQDKTDDLHTCIQDI